MNVCYRCCFFSVHTCLLPSVCFRPHRISSHYSPPPAFLRGSALPLLGPARVCALNLVFTPLCLVHSYSASFNCPQVPRFMLSANIFISVGCMGFPDGSKNPPANAGDLRDEGSIPGLGRSPGGGQDNPLQYSCLENPMDRGAWWATVHEVAKSEETLHESLHD